MLLKTFVATLALAVAGLTAPVPAKAAEPTADGPGYQAPVVGECHQLTKRQVYGISDPTDPVPCSSEHNVQVIAVAQLPADTDWRPDSPDLIAATAEHCAPAFRTALDASVKKIAMSSFSWGYWIPTKTQRTHGATWLRCDVARWNNASYGSLPEDVRLRGVLTKAEKSCISVTRKGYSRSNCAGRHNYRAVKAFVVPGPNSRMPSHEAFVRFAARHCPGNGWYATWRSASNWTSGDHSLTCYLPR